MKFSFKPVKPLRVAEEIAQQLKQSIILGHFGIGDKLPTEADLADQFQVSRTAVRDALRILKNSGFVVTRQGASGGAYVSNLTFERLAAAFLDVFQAEKATLLEVFDVRCLLEPEVARRAAEAVNPESAQRLTESMGVTPHFHLALAEMCGNRLLECLIRSTVDLSGRIIESTGADGVHPRSAHQQVLEAVLSGNGDAAAEAMRRHNMEAMESFRNSGMSPPLPGKRSKRADKASAPEQPPSAPPK
jgi:GntR family transcriptional regulator, transcriptional repressor for pyruvate dehydrogenase complex